MNYKKHVATASKLPDFLLKRYEQLKKEEVKQDYILELSNVDKFYSNGFQAIFNTNIRLKKGEFLALLGPSGCGKSTTLRMIAGLEQVSQGDIFINNVNVTDAEPAVRDLTMVFQNYALFPHLSVKNNIIFGLKANTKKIGKAGVVYKKINVLKSKIQARANLINNIQNLTKNEAILAKAIEKLKKTKTTLASRVAHPPHFLVEKIETKIFGDLTRKKRFQIASLESFISASQNKIAIWKKEAVNVPKMKEEIEQYKKEIQDLNNQLKDLVKAENTNEIIEQKLHDVTKVLELDYYLDQKPAQLSGGQRQRVALGRSIIGNPNLFLMDEPLSNLDAKLRATMRQKIRELHEKINSGTVYVTHDQIEAMTMADLIAVMTDGFVLQISNPNDLFKNPSCLFVASFVGSPEMNLFEGQFINNQFVSKKGVVWEIPKYKTNNLKPNQKIVFGIRPTDFSVDDSLLEAYKVQITTKIISKELLGNEILYRARIVTDKGLGDEIKFITSAYENYPLNSLQKIYPILSRIHLFDQETTISLTSELNLDTIKALRNWIGSADKIAIRTEILETAKVKSHKKSLVKQIYQKLRTSVINFKKSSTSINP